MLIPMNEEIRTEWVKRLRSGDYSQTQGKLRDGNGYCCLGVLCEIAVERGVIPEPILYLGKFSYAHMVSALPAEVQSWARLPTSEGGTADGFSLAGHNDAGMSFSEIADLLERED